MPKSKSHQQETTTITMAENFSLLLNEMQTNVESRISSWPWLTQQQSPQPVVAQLSQFGYCKICLNKFDDHDQTSYEIKYCKCRFCLTCLNQYIKQCIENFNVLPIYCPDPKCQLNGFLDTSEIKNILLNVKTSGTFDSNNNANGKFNSTSQDEINVTPETGRTLKGANKDNLNYYKKYLKISENIEIIRDPNRTYCPMPTCENVCRIERATSSNDDSSYGLQPVKVTCNKCNVEFCSNCFRLETGSSSTKFECKCNKKSPVLKSGSITAEATNSIATAASIDQEVNMSANLLFNFENIKQCPKCGTLFERADGCAQILCKCCKHTFCFYCLKSLENDFLLKHYTKNGPCQGKLGHSRVSLFFHRIRVMAVFSGTIFLVILLSPFILILLPCFLFSNRFRGFCYKFLEKYA